MSRSANISSNICQYWQNIVIWRFFRDSEGEGTGFGIYLSKVGIGLIYDTSIAIMTTYFITNKNCSSSKSNNVSHQDVKENVNVII